MKKPIKKNKSAKKFINSIIREELINELMSLKTAQQLSKETPPRQSPFDGFTTLNGKIVTKQDKAVSKFEKNIQPELMRVIEGLKYYLNFIPKGSADYRTVEDIIERALDNGKPPSPKEQSMVSYLAGKHGLKEIDTSGMGPFGHPTEFPKSNDKLRCKKCGKRGRDDDDGYGVTCSGCGSIEDECTCKPLKQNEGEQLYSTMHNSTTNCPKCNDTDIRTINRTNSTNCTCRKCGKTWFVINKLKEQGVAMTNNKHVYTADLGDKRRICPQCNSKTHYILNASTPNIVQCTKCKASWNPDNWPKFVKDYGMKEQGAGSGMELTTAANNPTNFGTNLPVGKPGFKNSISRNEIQEMVIELVEEELARKVINRVIHEELLNLSVK